MSKRQREHKSLHKEMRRAKAEHYKQVVIARAVLSGWSIKEVPWHGETCLGYRAINPDGEPTHQGGFPTPYKTALFILYMLKQRKYTPNPSYVLSGRPTRQTGKIAALAAAYGVPNTQQLKPRP